MIKMVAIKQQLVSSRAKTYDGKNGRKYITIHETANTRAGANAQAHANLQSKGFSASWHWTVDDNEAIQSFPHDVQCWHAGDGKDNGNLNSIGIEICVNSDGDFGKAVENAAALVKKIMQDEGISIENVVQHNHWGGKNCPTNLRNGKKGIKWNDFISMVQGVKVHEPKQQVKSETTASQAQKWTGQVLRKGAKGSLVKSLQELLLSKGFKLPKYGADSSFGDETESAVRAAQKATGISDDGVPGPQTYRALMNYEPSKFKFKHWNGSVIRKGERGKHVKELQDRLLVLGYKLPRFGADSSFGDETSNAVRQFQRDAGIKVDGVPGPKTFAKLFG